MTEAISQGFILAAGRGKRMQHLTNEKPKPLVEVAGKCLIDYNVERLKAAGITDCIVNLCYKGEMIKSHLQNTPQLNFIFSEEKEALDDREYALWKELRKFCLSLIKGKRTPLGFHFVLSMSAPNIARLLEQEHLSFAPADVQGLYLNFKYDGTKLSCTTGTSMNLFTLDKSLEQAWDKMAQRIFAKYEIPFEVE